MNPSTATLFQIFLSLRDGICTAIGERNRLHPHWLTALMTKRWNRLTRPVIHIFQHLIAGTYRPRAPRQPTPATAARQRAQRPPPPAELKHPLWLLKLLRGDWNFRYSAGNGVQELERLLAHPGLPEQLDAAPALRFHLRRLCN